MSQLMDDLVPLSECIAEVDRVMAACLVIVHLLKAPWIRFQPESVIGWGFLLIIIWTRAV